MEREDIKQQITVALGHVQDPELGRDLVSLNMVRNVAFCDGVAKIGVELTTPACPLKSTIEADVKRAVSAVPGVREVHVEFSAQVRQASAPLRNALPGVKNVLAVGAGKGGVGKSMVAVNAAVGLMREGAAVGLLDGDVYGPSVPTMLDLADARPTVRDERIVPIEWKGPAGRSLKVISIGFMVPPDRALVWRGPMVHGVMRQFLGQVDWGELDYLVIDLPPGTGDVPLTLAQSVPLTGAVVVATPQELALADARRAVRMFADVGVECLGIVENMSYYLCPGCGREDDIFGRGGAEQAAGELGVPFLGAIPINTAVRVNSDAGRPDRNFGDPKLAAPLTAFVRALAGQVSVRNLTKPPPQALGAAGGAGPHHEPIRTRES